MPPRFSIIVPCYNLAPWIRACLDSIAAAIEQCKRNSVKCKVDGVEVIVVDDESTDGSGKILDEYCARYSTATTSNYNFKVIHQKNKGEGGARNTGIAAAKGQWIFFLDGDDVMAPEALEKLAELIAAYPQEKLFRFGYEVFEDGATWTPSARAPEVVCKDISAAIPMDDFYTFVWQHLYRRDIIEGIAFKRYIRGCDRVFVDDVLLNRVDSFVETSEVFYGYRQRASSAVHVAPSTQVIVDEMDHRCDIVMMIENSTKKIVYAGSSWLEWYFTDQVGALIAEKPADEQDELWSEWLKCVCTMKGAQGLSLSTKLKYQICATFPFRSVAWFIARAFPWYKSHGLLPRTMRAVRRRF